MMAAGCWCERFRGCQSLIGIRFARQTPAASVDGGAGGAQDDHAGGDLQGMFFHDPRPTSGLSPHLRFTLPMIRCHRNPLSFGVCCSLSPQTLPGVCAVVQAAASQLSMTESTFTTLSTSTTMNTLSPLFPRSSRLWMRGRQAAVGGCLLFNYLFLFLSFHFERVYFAHSLRFHCVVFPTIFLGPGETPCRVAAVPSFHPWRHRAQLAAYWPSDEHLVCALGTCVCACVRLRVDVLWCECETHGCLVRCQA